MARGRALFCPKSKMSFGTDFSGTPCVYTRKGILEIHRAPHGARLRLSSFDLFRFSRWSGSGHAAELRWPAAVRRPCSFKLMRLRFAQRCWAHGFLIAKASPQPEPEGVTHEPLARAQVGYPFSKKLIFFNIFYPSH